MIYSSFFFFLLRKAKLYNNKNNRKTMGGYLNTKTKLTNEIRYFYNL